MGLHPTPDRLVARRGRPDLSIRGSGTVYVLLTVIAVLTGILGMHALSVGHHAATPMHTAASGPQPGDAGPAIHQPTATGTCDDPGATGAVCVAALTMLLLLGPPRQLRRRLTRSLGDTQPLPTLALRAGQVLPRPPSVAALCPLRI